MYSIDRVRYIWVGLSALFQGLLLGGYVYTTSGIFQALPLNVVMIVPFTFWLGQEHWGRRLKRFMGALTGVLLFFYAYWLWSVFPADGEFYYLPSQNLNLMRACIAVFLCLPFFQCRIATWSWRVPYSEVFFQLCRNVFLLLQSTIVMVVFWLLLLTASRLFEIIGLNFVPHFVFHPIVAFPLTSLTVAFSITLALKHPGIDSLGRWILSIMAWLLPPFSLLSLVFVISLPFSGLKTLLGTGQASTLMLTLQVATLLLANAAWLDGTRSPFSGRTAGGSSLISSTIEAISSLSLLCLPIYTVLCLYSLGIRVQQYGWSVDRIHAAFLVVVAGIWGLGYAGLVLLRQWPSSMGRVNTAAALIFTLLVIAMNSPLLDPCRLSANSQVNRLLTGMTDPAGFDFQYLRFNLGRYGTAALERLKNADDAPKADLIRRHMKEAVAMSPREYWNSVQNGLIPERARREILTQARVYPEGRVLPQGIVENLVDNWGKESLYSLNQVRNASELVFSFKKLHTDSDEESLLMIRTGLGLVFDVVSDDLQLVGTLQGSISPASLASEDFRSVTPEFMDVELNGQRFQIFYAQ
ncbi:MAG: DUF4153 domain-containing protein [Synergistaceae bacterium]|jgi:hypothetical protein|nr:DUF4153 domain-containing protein [Synergistaceae bacterium]